MNTSTNITITDKKAIRNLAKQYVDIYQNPVQNTRRELWRKKNSLMPVRPLIYVRAFAWKEMKESLCVCENPVLRGAENWLRHNIFWASLEDDSVFEPWLPVKAEYTCKGWGLSSEFLTSDQEGGAYKEIHPLGKLDQIGDMVVPHHEIDEEATERKLNLLKETIGDILPVVLDRSPYFKVWTGDLSTIVGHLRGIEPIMYDMMDEPEKLHELMSFLSRGVLKTHEEAEHNGDWTLLNHYNQAMPYSFELAAPNADGKPVSRKELWHFSAAQEFALISPAMHEEFLLDYQLPIMKEFGLVAYGCCEDLSLKIDMLRKIPNLRRIAVSPFANVEVCAERIGTDYVASYRPSPTDMVSYGFSPERIRKIMTRDFAALRGTHFDITLKDVETVQKDPERVRNWVKLTRQILAEMGFES